MSRTSYAEMKEIIAQREEQVEKLTKELAECKELSEGRFDANRRLGDLVDNLKKERDRSKENLRLIQVRLRAIEDATKSLGSAASLLHDISIIPGDLFS